MKRGGCGVGGDVVLRLGKSYRMRRRSVVLGGRLVEVGRAGIVLVVEMDKMVGSVVVVVVVVEVGEDMAAVGIGDSLFDVQVEDIAVFVEEAAHTMLAVAQRCCKAAADLECIVLGCAPL